MYKTTQTLNYIMSYDNLLSVSMKSKSYSDDFCNVNRIITIICLTTGLKTRFILSLKWEDILTFGSENDAVVKDELNFRNYLIPVDPIVKEQISQIFQRLKFVPDLNDLIISTFPDEYRNSPELLFPIITLLPATSIYSDFYDLGLESEFLKKNDYETFLQVQFGRKVFEVCGYSNQTSKSLKNHFEFKLNSQLFTFLGYRSKEEIAFEISNIDLEDGKPIVKFEDKNFNNKHPFQKFTSFQAFLNKIISRTRVQNSIELLLLISLNVGIKPSSLIHLKWQDVMVVNKENKDLHIVSNLKIGRHKLKLTNSIRRKLLTFFVDYKSDKNNFPEYYRKDNIPFLNINQTLKYISEPNLNGSIFTLNNGNQITQPSLSREIKKFLNEFGFRHADQFTSKSTSIMFGRRVLEIKGDHKSTIKALKEHFNFRSENDLFTFLYIDLNINKGEFKFRDKNRKTIFEEILYNLYDVNTV